MKTTPTNDRDSLPPRDERERGQTMAEYAVVLGVITIAIVTTFSVLSGAIESAIGGVVGLL